MSAQRAALLLSLCGAAGCGPAPGDVGSARRQRAITNGQPDSGHPSAGALYTTTGYVCSATLIGGRSVLTSAHCIEPGASYLFTVEGGPFMVISAVAHPRYGPSTQLHDLGLMRLVAAPPVEPSAISPDPPWVGLPIVIVGFGCTGGSAQSCTYGVKRMTTNTVETVWPDEFLFTDGVGKGGHCHGDSGGPSFASPDGREVLVGAHSHGPVVCGGDNFDARVDGELAWIRQQTGGDVRVGPHVPAPPLPDGAAGDGRDGASGDRGPADAVAPSPDSRRAAPAGGCAIGDDAAPRGAVPLLVLSLALLGAAALRARRGARGG